MANTTSPHNKEMFDHKECWENYDEGDLVTGKIRLISEMIPYWFFILFEKAQR